MKEYKAITGPVVQVNTQVTEHLNDGWELFGAPTSTTVNSNNVQIIQAVVKDKGIANRKPAKAKE
jgi:hypothetical protein